MRIVLIPSAELSYNSGSVIYAKMLFEYLLNNGHDVYMLGNCVPQDIDEKYKKYIKVGENLLFHPVIDDRYVSDLQYMKMYIDIVTIITEIYEEWNGIDVINAHYASINSYAALHIKKILKVPYVISSFGRDINIGLKCDERIKKFIMQSIPDADKVIVSEEKIGDEIRKQVVNIRERDILAVPMPLDERIFEESSLELQSTEEEKIISTINSCFTPEKGIEDILRAIASVKRKYRCKLFIAGQDDDENRVNHARLCSLIEELNLSKDVVFLGYLSRAEVGRLLEISDIFIDARRKGNFSSVLLEAQFKKCLTIASDNVAARKVITNEKNGLLFEIGDIEGLKKCIEKIFENKSISIGIKKEMDIWCDKCGKAYRKEICMQKIMEVFQSVKDV